jgi:hypothetical protein
MIDLNGRMCVGIDAHHAATFKPALVPAPIQIEPPWIGIDFNGDAARRAGSKNFLNVDLVAAAGRSYGRGWSYRDFLLPE